MLYRQFDSPFHLSLIGRLRGVVAGLARARRRRITQIDLMSASPHLKRDLGLQDGDLLDFLNP